VEERTLSIPSGRELSETCAAIVDDWHRLAPTLDWGAVSSAFAPASDGWAGAAAALCLVNCFQWHLEDECRAVYRHAVRLAALKRAIDESNRRRVARIDEIDERLVRQLGAGSDPDGEVDHVALVTPGYLLDRISILELKRYHAPPASELVAALADELADVRRGFDRLIDDLVCGRQRVRLYRTVKLYGAGP
jgi:hypothetical protein